MTTNGRGGASPSVTAAILAYNRHERLAVTLTKLHERLEPPDGGLEVIVVDNASTDGTAEMVRRDFPHVRLIVNPENEGIGGWNRAFAEGRGEWFLVLDDDCYVEGGTLRRALQAAEEHGADMVSLGVDSADPEQSFSDWYRTGLIMFWGCAVLISRRAVTDLGGFEERLFIWANELEFTMRFLDRGYRHLTLPELRAVHMKPVAGLVLAQHLRNMRNWGFIAGKLLRPGDAAVALASLLTRPLLERLRYPGALKGVPMVASGFRDGLRVRRPVRPAVSRAYRRNYVEFCSQLQLAARLHFLVRDRRRPRPDFRQRYWEQRPRWYPQASAASVRLRRG